MICIHMFLKKSYSIGFVIRNRSFPHLNSWIYSNCWILILKYTTHLFVCLPNQLLHCHLHNKKSNIKEFYHVVSRFFFDHAIFSSFISLFFYYHFLNSYLFMFGHLDFPHTYLLKLHHSYIFQLFHYSHLSHSHL